MNNWIIVWQVCLTAALTGFAILAGVVTIGGARDIRRLLQKLGEDAAESSVDQDNT